MGSATLMDTARVGRPTKACPVCAAVFTYGARGPVPVVCKECRNATYAVKSWGRPKLSPEAIKDRRDAAKRFKLSTAVASAGETVDEHGVRWRTIASAYHLYSVSEMGQVKRKGKSEPMALRLNHGGYPFVGLSYLGSKVKAMFVHILVVENFIGPKPDGCEVRHLNGDKQDNRLCNLAYGSRSTNARDNYWNGTCRTSTLSPITVGKIKELRWFDGLSLSAIARAVGVTENTVRLIIQGKTHRDVGIEGQRIRTA